MRKILICSMLLLSLDVSAKSMKEIWISMPDSMIPYLTKNLRTEMVDFVNMNIHADVKNKLQGTSEIDTLQATYMKANLNKVSTIQMKLLPTSDKDTITCVVKNFFGPAPESEIAFYSQEWKLLYGQTFNTTSLTEKPDTMSSQRYQQLCAMIDPSMIHAELNSDREELLLTISIPLLNKEINQQIQPIISQRKLKWDGKLFK